MTEANTPTPAQESSRPSSFLWLAAIAFAVVWASYLAFFGPRSGRPRSSGPVLNPPTQAATTDYHWTLVDLTGERVEFSRYRGRPVFLNLWATWCPPCVAEMPAIDKLAADPRLKDVVFLCVSVEDDPSTVKKFVESNALHVPVFLGGSAAPSPFLSEARVRQISLARFGATDQDGQGHS